MRPHFALIRRVVLLWSLLLTPALHGGTLQEMRAAFQRPPDSARIMMRWWWFGPAVDREEIEREMGRMKAAGIGGFELAVMYPLATDDPARGLRNLRWLSPEFLDTLGFTARKARELGMRMDLTLGSGWPFGGPYIPLEQSAGRLRSFHIEVVPGTTSLARPVPLDGERLIGAFVGRGASSDAPVFEPLDISGQGRIALPPDGGSRTVVYYFSSHTGQTVKRAAVGSEGYVLDHYSRTATETHLKEAGDKLLSAVGPGGVYSVFCDSLEVYGSNWTADMLEQFRRRRGYDLQPLLPLLEFDSEQRAESVRRDYGRTLTELYEERFLVPMHEWSRKHGVLFRIQSYGEPPASLASYRNADLFDGEGWHWRRLDATRWASSATHLFGKAVTASEMWTWAHSPVFRATPLDLKAEADRHFLLGANQVIGHGWPYSPPQAGIPGWTLYAAAALDNRNPWWPVMPELSLYLQRLSYLLRQGEPVADVALYAPTEDAWSEFRSNDPGILDLRSQIAERMGPAVIPAILDAGYSFDVIDDGTLAMAGGRYKAIVLPNVRWMPEESARWLAQYAKGGGTVLALSRKPEAAWPDLALVKEEELALGLGRAAAPDVTLAPTTPEVGFVHRRLPDGDLYFLANTANTPKKVKARFRVPASAAEVWNPLTGRVSKPEAAGSELTLEFEPYGSVVVVFRRGASDAPDAAPRAAVASENLRSGWKVEVGGKVAETALPHSWADDASTRAFSGAAVYSRVVDVSAPFRAPGVRVYLDFGDAHPAPRDTPPEGSERADYAFSALLAAPVRDAATVTINGKAAGALWCPPYRLDVTNFLKDGANEIRVEVYNTLINRIASAKSPPNYTAVIKQYGVRFRMQELENAQPLPSGILGEPRLVAER